MPHVNIWVRKEDYDKWLSIVDKPSWIHDRLGNVIVSNPSINRGEKVLDEVVYTSDWGA